MIVRRQYYRRGNIMRVTPVGSPAPAEAGLERVTVNLVPRAAEALRRAVELTGDSKTDTINRALQLYAYIIKDQSEGKDFLIRDTKGELDKLVLM
jgi:hypothetical protein